jgi:P-type Mg2+ transporter
MSDWKLSFWSLDADDVKKKLDTTEDGLSAAEAAKRLEQFGVNSLKPQKSKSTFRLLLAQFQSPIILILLAAVVLSFFVKDQTDAYIILGIVLVSGLLGFWQERGARDAVAKLLDVVKVKSTVVRGKETLQIAVEEIVPGDIIQLKAGAVVPADCIIIKSDSLNLDEAALTGESFPVEKEAGAVPEAAALADRKDALWMGTHVISGTAVAIAVQTGRDTQFGRISEKMRLKPPETQFEVGIRRFGYFLMEVTMLLVFVIFAVNVFMKRPVLDSFLFSLALAVGLTPSLLPAIISINLAHGAKMMAKFKVIVKRLAAIENFGSMNVLCSDKTGTLTEGSVKMKAALDVNGQPSENVFKYAYINAFFETGFLNPIDNAIRNFETIDVHEYTKYDEHPYDFIRKRLSILVSEPAGAGSNLSEPGAANNLPQPGAVGTENLMVTKGALANVLSVCRCADMGDGRTVELSEVSDAIQKLFESYSGEGLRTLGVAYKRIADQTNIEDGKEEDMVFAGFITLFDPLKENISATIDELGKLGVQLKVVTGDNKLVAANIFRQMGIADAVIMTGEEIAAMSDRTLMNRVGEVNVFAELEPNEKERIIVALKKAGFVVGYMGDGINDAAALHVADVSISVDDAVDVAKDAADIVLLEKDLEVLVSGVKAGRMTFANTLKYVFMATSANFGNMFSMAGASIFLPFLPLLPSQILLTNMLTDFPEMSIASDSVDADMLVKPRRWNIAFIRKFMLTFGLISSIFDYLTFGLLMLIFHSDAAQFRTGWFIESVISASIIVLVIRTSKPFYKSRPGKYLLISTGCVALTALNLPYTPIAGLLGFTPISPLILLAIAGIAVVYIVVTETAKRIFYKKVQNI